VRRLDATLGLFFGYSQAIQKNSQSGGTPPHPIQFQETLSGCWTDPYRLGGPTMPTEPPDRASGRTPLPVLRLDAAPGCAAVMTADIEAVIGGEPMRLALTVPSGPARVDDLLPVFRGLADAVVGIGVRQVEQQGARVSCRAGCGACCRQPVPVAEAEARAIRRLVEAMPEPRRTQVRERFAAAVRRLADGGLLDRVRDTGRRDDLLAVAVDYFRLGLACPFLEDESCSIHPDRPIACREYLVTSPAEECGRPAEGRVSGVSLPVGVGQAVRALDRQASASASGWVPLVLALEWAEAHPEPPPAPSGPDLLEAFFARLAEAGPQSSGKGAPRPEGTPTRSVSEEGRTSLPR
jgi:Fe-S-cluster containining protein